MDRPTWRQRVGMLTFRSYTEPELELLEELMVARVYEELRTPWNYYWTIGTPAPAAAQIQLDPRTRHIDGVGYRAIGSYYSTRLERISLREAVEVSPGGSLGPVSANTPRAGWFIANTALQAPNAPNLGITPASLVVKGFGTPEAETIGEVVVQWWGVPVDVWEQAGRFVQLYLWGGAVEGFQLQGDEQGRERALRMFAAELERVNSIAEWSMEQTAGHVRSY